MAQLEPGTYFYTDEIVRDLVQRVGEHFQPERVHVREVDKGVLGVYFEGRQDYDLAKEMTGRFDLDPNSEIR